MVLRAKCSYERPADTGDHHLSHGSDKVPARMLGISLTMDPSNTGKSNSNISFLQQEREIHPEQTASALSLVKMKGSVVNQITACYRDCLLCLAEGWAVALCKVNCLHSNLFGVGFPVCLIKGVKHTMASFQRGYLLSPLIVKIWEKVSWIIYYQ